MKIFTVNRAFEIFII